jgi:hypothetical protein
MSEPEASTSRRKTPSEASEFEREQLRFLLSGNDVSATLAAVNPSLAWLPILKQMQVVTADGELAGWIERNFSDEQAVRDVVANIHFFGLETARILEHSLNRHAGDLRPLLLKSWQLIIRSMKVWNRNILQNEWFEVVPRIKSGGYSSELLERIAVTLRPKLRVEKRLSLHGEVPERAAEPSDLMSLRYEVADGVSADQVLKAWPADASVKANYEVLSQLTLALRAALADATDDGVEVDEYYSASDRDVPSVAEHEQNRYRSGFQAIVRVMVEIWLRLAKTSPSYAILFVQQWRQSGFRLMRRLALFACTDPIVPAELGADILTEIPSSELFLSQSSVEVHQLIRARWRDFASDKREAILNRLSEGPPRQPFREGADIDRAIDRRRFDILAEMERNGLEIGQKAEALLKDIRAREPNWALRPAEQAGFGVWHEGARAVVSDARKLDGIPDDALVLEAKRITATPRILDGDVWQALCSSDPDRALRGLEISAARGDLPIDLWQQFLWGRSEYSKPDVEKRVAELIARWPQESFEKIIEPASSWLELHAQTLNDSHVWQVWDRIADATLETAEEAADG